MYFTLFRFPSFFRKLAQSFLFFYLLFLLVFLCPFLALYFRLGCHVVYFCIVGIHISDELCKTASILVRFSSAITLSANILKHGSAYFDVSPSGRRRCHNRRCALRYPIQECIERHDTRCL